MTTMTDDDVLAHAPTACALICAVHDQDADATLRLLADAPTDLAALLVLLARMVPDDRPMSELLAEHDGIQRNADGLPVFAEDWPEDELRAAHAAWNRREHTAWSEAGEREYQRRRQERRRARRAGTEGIRCPECGQMPRNQTGAAA